MRQPLLLPLEIAGPQDAGVLSQLAGKLDQILGLVRVLHHPGKMHHCFCQNLFRFSGQRQCGQQPEKGKLFRKRRRGIGKILWTAQKGEHGRKQVVYKVVFRFPAVGGQKGIGLPPDELQADSGTLPIKRIPLRQESGKTVPKGAWTTGKNVAYG